MFQAFAPKTSAARKPRIGSMSDDPSAKTQALEHEAPNTLEGYSILHQVFRLRREALRALWCHATRDPAAGAGAISAMARREDGESALFSALGHKGDLLIVHFRRGFEELERAQADVAALELNAFIEQSGSYLFDGRDRVCTRRPWLSQRRGLMDEGLRPHSPEWIKAVQDDLEDQRHKLGARLWPRIPDRRYVCFYPMNKRRAGRDNWYSLPIEERQLLMRDHGMIGRRYAGQVTQVISGSIGFDDWEWGVDLFADDPWSSRSWSMKCALTNRARATPSSVHSSLRSGSAPTIYKGSSSATPSPEPH